MKLTLIKPNIGRMEHSLFVDEARMEPLPLGVIAGVTPPDVSVQPPVSQRNVQETGAAVWPTLGLNPHGEV